MTFLLRHHDMQTGAELRTLIKRTKAPNRVWLTVAVGHGYTRPVWWPKSTARELAKYINNHKRRAAARVMTADDSVPPEWRGCGVKPGDLVVFAGLQTI